METKIHSSEERIWAVLAHVSGLLFFFGLVPLLVWATQRRKSPYVAFHALQAFGYQTISIVLWMLASFILPFLSVLLIIPLAIIVERFQPDPALVETLMPIIMLVVIILPLLFVFGIYWLQCLIAALFVFMDKDFRYPLLGNWLARYLKYEPDNLQTSLETAAEERWVAGLGHTGVLIMFFGMLVPLAIWVAEKNRSNLIRFQALQAVIYQGLGALGYLLIQIGYLVLNFIFLGAIFLTGVQSDNFGASGAFSAVTVLSFLIIFCCAGLAMIATPLYYLLGLFAAIRVIGGHNFKYPLLGKLIWNLQNKPVAVNANIEEQNVSQ